MHGLKVLESHAFMEEIRYVG